MQHYETLSPLLLHNAAKSGDNFGLRLCIKMAKIRHKGGEIFGLGHFRDNWT